jgi:hypothetical protein
MLLYLAGVNEHAVLRVVGSKRWGRSTFSEDNSVPYRIRRSLLGSLTLLHRSRRTFAAGKDGITSCLPTAQLSACLYLSLGTGPSLLSPHRCSEGETDQ